MSRKPVIVTSLVCMAMVPGALLVAGPLDPPAGPIAPTPGPEPRIAINAVNTPGDAFNTFKIAQPGSYYFESNLTGENGKFGIKIEASNVTIDLMGFTLQGVPGSRGGIDTPFDGGLKSLTIRNGVVSDWGETGINLGISFLDTTGARLEDLHVADNGSSGMLVGGAAIVNQCTATGNGSIGIQGSSASVITECTAILNGSHGILASGHISACTAISNDGDGFLVRGVITQCTAEGNEGDGIQVSFDSIVTGNTCNSNGFGGDGAGIYVQQNDNRIEGNVCTNNDRGIDVDAPGNFIIRNVCSGNGTNWTIVANNFYSNIVNRAGATTLSINGDSGVSTLGTVDHTANFTY